MPSEKRKFGDSGEREAETFLSNKGYKIIDRNYRIKNLGEIDLVAEKDRKLFFFEVKTRDAKHESDYPIGYSINAKKRTNLNKICQLYLANRQIPSEKEWQVNAIFIKVNFGDNSYKIEHVENILWEQYY